MKIAIFGAGKLGISLTEALLQGGNDISLVDSNEALIQRVGNRFDVLTINADARKIETLTQMHINKYDLVIAVTESDEVNMLVSRFAKKLGCEKTIARVRTPEYMEQLGFIKDCMKIDYVINPDRACADEIYKYLTEKYSFKGGKYTTDGVTIAEYNISTIPELKGKKLKECNRILKGLLIGAISRESKIIVPNGETELMEGDTLYLIGVARQFSVVHKERHKGEHTDIKKVMIAGGGKTAFFLADRLSEFGTAVKIIEIDRERCEYLSARLPEALILNADAADINLLREENLESMDAFVAVTGFDEENLLLSLTAKKSGVEDVVTKISRKSYAPLLDTLDVSMLVNPLDICASDILKYIKKDGTVIFSQIIRGQAEFIEIWADRSMPITEKTLMEIDIPEGVLIAAIHRNGEIIIPSGRTKITDGDRVIILSLLSSVPMLEGLFKKSRVSAF